MRDTTDRVRFRTLRESVDCERIRRSPRGDSSLKCLRGGEPRCITRLGQESPSRVGTQGGIPEAVTPSSPYPSVYNSELRDGKDLSAPRLHCHTLPAILSPFPKQRLTQQCWWWKRFWLKTRRSGHGGSQAGTVGSCRRGRWQSWAAPEWWLSGGIPSRQASNLVPSQDSSLPGSSTRSEASSPAPPLALF